MNKWKIAFFASAAILIATNSYLLYSLIDGGISYSYLQDSYDSTVKQNQLLGDLIVAGATEYTQKDMVHLLRQANPDALIVEEGETVIIEGISFEFRGDRLVKVR